MSLRRRSLSLLVSITLALFPAIPQALASCGTAPTAATTDTQIRMKGSGSFGTVVGLGTPAEGDIAYDATNHLVAFCNGSSWIDIGAASLTGSGTQNYVARWTSSAALGTGVLYDNGTNVGINTTSPAGTLDVEGGTAAVSTNAANINFVAQNAGTGNKNGGNILLSPGVATGTGTPGGVGVNGAPVGGSIFSATLNNPSTTPFYTFGFYYNKTDPSGGMNGMNSNTSITLSAGNNSNQAYGAGGFMNLTLNGKTYSGTAIGLWGGTTPNTADTGSVSGTLIGVQGDVQNNGGDAITNAYGVSGYVSNVSNGSITNAASIYAGNASYTGGSGAAVTNAYGIFIGAQNGTATNSNYALYSYPNLPSYFAGSVGVGTTSPTHGNLEINGNGGSIAFDTNGTYSGTISAPDGADIAVTSNRSFTINTGTNTGFAQFGVNGGLNVGYSSLNMYSIPANGLVVSGNVGIGTASTTSKLQVEGITWINQGGANNASTRAAGLTVDSSVSTAYANGTDPGDGNRTLSVITGVAGAPAILSLRNVAHGTFWDMVMDDNDSDKLKFSVEGSQPTMTLTNGSVGIGTAAPQWTFHIRNGATQDMGFLADYLSLGGGSDIASVNDANNTNEPLGFAASKYDFAVGNVGIGTTAPGYSLDVSGTVRSTGLINTGNRSYFTGTDGSNNHWFSVSTSATEPTGLWMEIVSSSGTVSGVNISPNGGSSGLYVKNGGNVGIGTTGPSGTLDVYANSAHALTVNSSNGYIGIGTAGGSYPVQLRAGADKELNFRNDPATFGFSSSLAGIIIQGINDAQNTYEPITFATTAGVNFLLGNIGIGTASPSSLLHVYGGQAKIDDGNSGALGFWSGGSFFGGLGTVTGIATGTGSNNEIALYAATSRGLHFYSNGTENMTLLSGGNVGIGTTGPTSKLQVSGGAVTIDTAQFLTVNPSDTFTYNSQTMAHYGLGWFSDSTNGWGSTYGPTVWLAGYGGIKFFTQGTPRAVIDPSGNVGVGTTSASYTLTVNGTAWVTSGAWSGSDRRWKKDITPLKNSLDKVMKLQGVNYLWRREEFPDKRFTDGLQIGLIAQDTEKVLPEIVTTDKEGYKGISYEKLTPVLVEAVKELKADNDSLRAANNDELAQIKTLTARLDKLEAGRR